MSKEEKKAIEKVPAKVGKVPIKAGKAISPMKNVPANHVLATFEDTLEDFRRRFQENIWTPWEWAIEPYTAVELPVRMAYSDLSDEGNRFLVRAEVPGIPRDKIDVTVTKDGIEISGETDAEREENEKNFVVRERSYSSIYKNLAFPEEVIPDKAECKVKDGVLEVIIPKKTPTPEVKKHKVEVKEAD
jgi:HSP20 family molecular chaperone IbpA